jgi:hypothetical protein
MATYVLPDDRFTDQQRDGYYFTRTPEDAYAFMARVQQEFPAVFDDVVSWIASPCRLAEVELIVAHMAEKAEA